MKTIFRNGIIKDVPYYLGETDDFGIQEIDDSKAGDITYQGDSINYDLDNALVSLYDLFRDKVFKDIDQYYKEVQTLPNWVQYAGQSSDTTISSKRFSKLIKKSTVPDLFSHLYLVDCQFLVGTVQNLLSAMEAAFINYFKLIASFPVNGCHKCPDDPNGTIMVVSSNSVHASSAVETYFTKAYSVLDIMCKICYEIQYLRTEFNEYQKTKSAGILWGARNKLIINGVRGTVFEKCELISNIEAIRNEIVHNGTWELNPRVFIKFKDGEEFERFMLYPDMEQGHLATVKNRRHFFSSNDKINDILPAVHGEFKQRVLMTIYEISNIYATF